jgi:hypothetical protein
MFRPGILDFKKEIPVSGGGGSSTLLNNLVAYYAFEETSGVNCYDSTANDRDLSINGATINQAGQIGKCYTYDGNDIVGDTTISAFNLTNLSVSVWFKTNSTNTVGLVGNYYWDDTGWDVILSQDWPFSGNLVFSLRSTNTPASLELGTTGALNNNAWHHALCTFNGTTANIYVDGNTTPNDSSIWANTIDYTANNLFAIGYRGGINYTGSIDEIGVWSRALTTSELTELWNGGTGKTYPFS